MSYLFDWHEPTVDVGDVLAKCPYARDEATVTANLVDGILRVDLLGERKGRYQLCLYQRDPGDVWLLPLGDLVDAPRDNIDLACMTGDREGVDVPAHVEATTLVVDLRPSIVGALPYHRERCAFRAWGAAGCHGLADACTCAEIEKEEDRVYARERRRAARRQAQYERRLKKRDPAAYQAFVDARNRQISAIFDGLFARDVQ